MGLKFNFFQAAKKGKLLRRHVDKGKDIDKMYRIHIPFADFLADMSAFNYMQTRKTKTLSET